MRSSRWISFGFIGISLICLVYGAELPRNTEITGDRLEMDSYGERNVFNFYGNVCLKGEDLEAYCDQLEVIAKKGEGETSASLGQDSVEKITGIGNVRIQQVDRTIRAGYAVLYPVEGKAVLTVNPEVTDSQGTVKGDRIVFYKNDRKAYVEGGPEGGRPRVILPSLPGLDKEEVEVKEVKIEKLENKDQSKSNKI